MAKKKIESMMSFGEKIKLLSAGQTGKLIIEVLDEVQRKVADIREPVPVKEEIANQVRIGVIGIIDKFLIEPLKVAGGLVEPPDRNEFE